MEFIQAYQHKLKCNASDDVFSYLIDTLKPTIRGWNYFVNWQKVIFNYKEYEIELNILNSIIGKESLEDEILNIFQQYPKTKNTIPLLLACRDKSLMLLIDYQDGFKYRDFKFNEDLSSVDAVLFMKESGLLSLFQNRVIKSIPDYVIGIETGLDSNGRKNRSGTAMESIVEYFIKNICQNHNWNYISQATYQKILNEWNIKINVEKTSRTIDFAILANDILYLVETNFYGGTGSKLKSTAGEYKSDFIQWQKNNHQFIWVTDGFGWKNTQKPLRETFDITDYILNLDMLEKGILEDIINNQQYRV